MTEVKRSKAKAFIFLITFVMIASVFALPEKADAASRYPSKVTGVKAVATDYDDVKLSWNKKSGVSGYKVYRSTKKNSGYKLIKTVKGRSKTSYKDTGLKTNKTYYYKVKAYKVRYGKTYKSKSYSSVRKVRPGLFKPSNVKITKNEYKKVQLKWKKGKNARGVKIYRSTKKNSGYKLVKTTRENSWTDTSVSPNKKYYYKLKSYNRNSKNKYQYSYMTDRKVVNTVPATPKSVKTTTDDFYIKVSWGKVTGATKYKIYRSDGKTYTTKSTSHKDYNVTKGKTYKYKVKAYGTKYGKYSSYVTAKPVTKSVESHPQEAAYLKYNKDGNTAKATKIYIGQKWTDSVNASLNGGEPVEKLLTRSNTNRFEGGNQDVYCFDTEDYDNFLIVYVKGGKINAWQTTAKSLGVYKGVNLKRGTKASTYDKMFHEEFSGPYMPASEVEYTVIKRGDVFFGGIIGDLEDWDTYWSNDLKAEEKICEMTINAFRVMNKRSILEHNKYLYGDGKTYGALAWSKTMAASNDVQHSNLKKGPLAGQDASDRGSAINDASKAEKELTAWNDNITNATCGEMAADAWYRSTMHCLAMLQALDDSDFYEPMSLHAAAVWENASGSKIYWTWYCGSYKLDFGIVAPTPVLEEVTETTATISWNDTVAGIGSEQEYVYEYSLDKDFKNIYKRVCGNVTKTTRKNLEPNTTYYFRIMAETTINGIVRGSEWSDVIKFTTLPIVEPDLPSEPDEPTLPEQPVDPAEPTEPTDPTDSETPSSGDEPTDSTLPEQLDAPDIEI